MPIYEYECGCCRHRFEIRQGFDEESQAVCPQCQGDSKRVFFPTPIIFKGSGFYVTDSRNVKSGDNGAGKSEAGKGEKAA